MLKKIILCIMIFTLLFLVSASTSREIPEAFELYDVDGEETNFILIYKGEEFIVLHEEDNWRIYNSYKITSRTDILAICQALIDIHPIHGKDMISFRTAEDMTDEWVKHNFVYSILSKGNWKDCAGTVDLDPKDQGATLIGMYEMRK